VLCKINFALFGSVALYASASGGGTSWDKPLRPQINLVETYVAGQYICLIKN